MTETILTNKKHGMLVLLLTLALYVLAVIGTILFAVEAWWPPWWCASSTSAWAGSSFWG